MPELPEVETMRRGVSGIVGSRVCAVERPRCRRKPIQIRPRIDVLSRRIAGRTVAAVERLGKRVVVRLDDDQTLVLEPRMTGLVLVADPPSLEHLRLRVRLAGGPHGELLFWDRRGLGTVRLYAAGELEAHLGSGALGPDALKIDRDTLVTRLRRSRRAVKVALLDQAQVAGIGNLYAAEILHHAGIDPRCRCDQLTGAQWDRLFASLGAVLRKAIRYEGSTLGDGTYRNALNNPGQYQNHHQVYARAGEPCPRCQSAMIERIVQAQRATFFCPRCQRKRGIHPALAAAGSARRGAVADAAR